MLLSEAFGGQGGIAKFNRDFLRALGAADRARVVHVEALPRAAAGSIEALPAGVRYDRWAAQGALTYLRRVARLIVRRGGFDAVICGHINLLPFAWCLARVKGARLVLVIHGYEAWTPPRRLLVRHLAARIDGLIAVSRLSAERFCGWTGFPVAKTDVLPNGVDLDRFAPAPRDEALAARYGLPGGPALMTLGRMAAHERRAGVDKGFERLIALMPRLRERVPGLRAVIAGDGDDRPRLEAQAAALGLGDSVIFAGAVDDADKAALYNLADVFVLPSLGEGFGIVLIEAAACGLTVVGSNRDASREALLDGALGRLVDPLDSTALERAIVAALAGAGHRQRRAGVEWFSSVNFERRVGVWLDTLVEQPGP
jgi:phosphatidylinositol alpha-1,6-mannosyltransferase